MRVKKLLNNMKTTIVVNHRINGIKNNSLDVKENDIFVAIKGTVLNGHDYINEAINKGAKTIIHEEPVSKVEGINYCLTDDSKKTLAIIANIFFKDITKKVKLIGITGTNGKTTISTVISSFLEYSGINNLLIGTNGIKIMNECFKTPNTTPDIILTLNAIYEAYKRGIKHVIMEVSSHAIKELRIFGFHFDIGVFSNLTHDHLDYHKNMEDYIYTKAHFINMVEKMCILNKDSPHFFLLNKWSNMTPITYGIKSHCDYQAIQIIKSFENGTSFKCAFKNNKKTFHTALIGEFNVYNLLAVLATIDYMKLSIDSFVSFLKIYVSLKGRMEMYEFKKRMIIVDYAHTPDGVNNVCLNLKEYTNNKLKVIIGCGGNRDKEKRPIIGEIVTRLADYVIFTNDNPRDENEGEIIKDIIKGVSKTNYEVILNREKAIYKMIKNSEENDVIAILGKGCETHQIVKGIKYPFNDLEIVKKIMKRVFL